MKAAPLMSPGLSQGCGTRRFSTLIAAEKAVDRGAEGTPQECSRGGLVHWHLSAPARDTGPSQAVRRLVLRRDSFACAGCGKSVAGIDYSIQHRIARGMGGTSRAEANSPANLVLLCGSATTPDSCHLACEDRKTAMRRRGLWLKSTEVPALVPVEYATPGGPVRYFLLPDGGRRRVESEAAA